MLWRIKQLLGDMAPRMDANLLQESFLQYLPASIRMVLTPSAEAFELEPLAQLADRILEASPTPIIATATADQATTTTQLAMQVAQLTERLDKLTSQMAQTINQLTHQQHQSQS